MKKVILTLLLLAAAASAQAQEIEKKHAWSFAIAPSVGATVPMSKLGPFAIGGLELDLALPVADRRLVLALDGSITRPTFDGSGTNAQVGGAYDYTIHETELKVALDVIFRIFGEEKRLVPFIGVGPMLHMLKTEETTNFAPGTNTEQDTKVGFEILAGLDFRLGPGLLLGELRATYSGLDHRFTGTTNAGNVVFAVGYRLTF